MRSHLAPEVCCCPWEAGGPGAAGGPDSPLPLPLSICIFPPGGLHCRLSCLSRPRVQSRDPSSWVDPVQARVGRAGAPGRGP